jgi:hypothetical protein
MPMMERLEYLAQVNRTTLEMSVMISRSLRALVRRQPVSCYGM